MKAGALLFGLLVPGAVQGAVLEPGDHRFSVHAGGIERRYLVHMPSAVPALPAVVLNLHGGGGEAEAHRRYTRMDDLADREGFVAVYPFGTGRLKSKLLTWNAGPCCGSAAREKVDDVAFIAALLDDLAARTSYDRTRVYATGHSNGAMMAYRLAADLPGRIAAIGPVAGIVAPGPLTTRRAVPVMHIHSVDDPRALYQGGLGPPFPFTNARVQHVPVEATLARWVELDGCRRTPERAERRQWSAPQGMHTAERLVFSGCRDGAEVVLWKLTGAGHVWPGGRRDYLRRWLGPSTLVIDANDEMWRFFTRFSIKEAKP